MSHLKDALWFVSIHPLDVGGQEEVGPQPALALVNGSPRVPRGLEAGSLPPPPPPASVQHARPECFDVTLHRKDNEGFGFVILTSKNKPPPGGLTHARTHTHTHTSALTLSLSVSLCLSLSVSLSVLLNHSVTQAETF